MNGWRRFHIRTAVVFAVWVLLGSGEFARSSPVLAAPQGASDIYLLQNERSIMSTLSWDDPNFSDKIAAINDSSIILINSAPAPGGSYHVDLRQVDNTTIIGPKDGAVLEGVYITVNKPGSADAPALILENIAISGAPLYENGIILDAYTETFIQTKGQVSIGDGIFASAGVTILNEGALTATNNYHIGICSVNGGVTIWGSGYVDISGKNYGVFGARFVDIEGSSITITGKESYGISIQIPGGEEEAWERSVTLRSEGPVAVSGKNYAIYATDSVAIEGGGIAINGDLLAMLGDLNINSNGDVTATVGISGLSGGGNVRITGEDIHINGTYGLGIRAVKDLEIIGNSVAVTAVGYAWGNISTAIDAYGSVTIQGQGPITVIGKDYDDFSRLSEDEQRRRELSPPNNYGIFSSTGDVTIINKSDEPTVITGKYSGIIAGDILTIQSRGPVEIAGGAYGIMADGVIITNESEDPLLITAGEESGISAPNGYVLIQNQGTIEITGGNFGIETQDWAIEGAEVTVYGAEGHINIYRDNAFYQ